MFKERKRTYNTMFKILLPNSVPRRLPLLSLQRARINIAFRYRSNEPRSQNRYEQLELKKEEKRISSLYAVVIFVF